MPSVPNSETPFYWSLTRIRADYLEMPGMRLTAAQVQRLCGIDGAKCQRVLDALVETKFLYMSPDGRYARVMESSRPHLAKASLRKPHNRL